MITLIHLILCLLIKFLNIYPQLINLQIYKIKYHILSSYYSFAIHQAAMQFIKFKLSSSLTSYITNYNAFNYLILFVSHVTNLFV